MYCANTRQTDRHHRNIHNTGHRAQPPTSKDGKQRPALGLREFQLNVSHRRGTREASAPMLINNQSQRRYHKGN